MTIGEIEKQAEGRKRVELARGNGNGEEHSICLLLFRLTTMQAAVVGRLLLMNEYGSR
jgi:hypothetical protein